MTRLRTVSAVCFVLVPVGAGAFAAGESLSFDPAAPVGGKRVDVRLAVSTPRSASTSYRVSLTGPATPRALEVVLGPNQSSTRFSITTTPVTADTSVSICASTNPPACDASATFMVRAPRLEALAFNVTRAASGTPFQGTVSLDGAAPAGGFEVDFVQSPSAGAAPPPSGVCSRLDIGALAPDSVLIPAGSASKSFTIPTFRFGDGGSSINELSVVVAARAGGIEKSQLLTVEKLKFTSFTVQPSAGARPLNVTVAFSLNGGLPASRTVVAQSEATLTLDKGEIVLAPGQASGSFPMTLNSGKAPVGVSIFAACVDSKSVDVNLLPAL